MLLIMFLKSIFIFFFELLKSVLLKITVLLETISRKMFYFMGSKSYPSVIISANEENEPYLI